MRIINENGNAAAVVDFFQSSRHRLQAFNAAKYRLGGQSQSETRSDRAQDIFQIGGPDEGRGEIVAYILHLELAAHAGDVALKLNRMNVPLLLAAVTPGIQA